jgi:DNA processing protein
METRIFPQSEWPTQLLEIPQPPKKLWIRGAMPPAETKFLTVVGSRALSPYGAEACRKLVSGLAGYPISVISGLALGTDACAHKTALSAGLHTIAIPGSGLDDSVISPRTNVSLAKDILNAGGALISEQEPTHKPWLKEFPSRNRLMVGMSHAVLIIEAGEKSGTLITARLAGEYNRDLMCLPHRIGDPHAFGPHLFIRLGATLVTDSQHILQVLHIRERQPRSDVQAYNLDETERVIWDMLTEPMPRDEILRDNADKTGELLTALVALELRGLIKEEFGAWRRS